MLGGTEMKVIVKTHLDLSEEELITAKLAILTVQGGPERNCIQDFLRYAIRNLAETCADGHIPVWPPRIAISEQSPEDLKPWRESAIRKLNVF
jgi:hypothetical protein